MINEDFVAEKKEAQSYPPIPKDIYQAELLDVNVQNSVTFDTRNKPDTEKKYEKTLSFQFTLLNGKDGEKSLRGRNIWANLIPSYLYISSKTGKNKLYKIVESFIGRELTPEEEANGITAKSLNSLIGMQIRLVIEPKTNNGKAWDNITDYLKAGDKLPSLTAEEKDKARVKERQHQPEAELDANGMPPEGTSEHPQFAPADDIQVENIPW